MDISTKMSINKQSYVSLEMGREIYTFCGSILTVRNISGNNRTKIIYSVRKVKQHPMFCTDIKFLKRHISKTIHFGRKQGQN